MGKVNGSAAIASAGSTDVIEFNGGVEPGIVATDPLGRVPAVFTITNWDSLAAKSFMAVSVVANNSTANQNRDVLNLLVRELIRKKVIEGTY